MNDVGREMQQHVPKPIAEDWGHLDPSRWWFAQSAFPLIAGTLGPVATAFSICALVRPWRQLFPPGTDVDQAPSIPDPDWLIAINAVQLAVAVVANMALLLNMTRRLSFSIAQPVTIVGWYVSSMTLVALTATASGPLALEPPTKFIWSQAFYYAIYSAVLYFLVAALLTVTYTAAQSGRYSKDFMLTPSQRTLMLQTIMFLLYLLLGALLFSKLEDWPYLDAVYWAAVTLFTVGFGDFRPETKVGRALLMPYALIGIISLGLVIGSIRSLVLDRAKRRIGARMVEKRRRHTLRRLSALGRDDILVPIGDELPSLSPARTDSSGMTEFERRELEFKLMRKIQRIAARRRRWFAMAISAGTWLALWLAGARVFQVCEEPYQGWTYFDGFYFAFVSFTTIGYGDLTPVSNPGRSFWVFWALLAVPTMTVLISNAGETIIKAIRDATDQIATVTILPSEQGFKKDFKRLLRTLSFGVLFEEEDVAEEPPGFLGLPIRLIPRSSGANNNNNNDDNDAAETMQRDEAHLEAEGADTEKIKQRRAEREEYEEGNAAQVEANAAGEVARSKPSPSSHRSRSAITFQTPSRPASRRPSPARRHLPSSVPASRPDYHVTLIEEIGRVTRHLKHHPPRKYTFREWAWYLRLIGEDEADAERHRKANPKAKGTKERRRTGNLGEVGPDGHPLPWSWVGSRSPLMGSQEEAEWILARLIARLGEELRDVREEEQGTFGTDSRGRERSL